MTASQVVLSVILPFVSAPLIWFTCLNRYMTVRTEEASEREGEVDVVTVPMRNNLLTSVVTVLVWVVIVVMNVALLVLVGMGKAS